VKAFFARLLVLAGVLLPASTIAQTAAPSSGPVFPTKPVRWIVPFPPGGVMDALARTLGEKMSASVGQPVVIENRPGAGGNIGSELVAKAPPDGHTILIVSIGHATNPSLYGKMPFDPITDFAPVSLLAIVPNVLVAHPSVNAKTVREVIELAKSQPGKITYASAGNGTSIHLAGELFSALAGVELVHVPYKGSGPAVADLIGGQVSLMFDSITSAQPHIKAGKLRAYAVTSGKRSRTMPDLPTVAEAGVPGYEVSPWFAVFAPAGTPRLAIAKLNEELTRALKLGDVETKLAAIGAEPIGSTPEALAAHLKTETARWSAVIKARNIRAD
jgi:tripartite-type tricarboxylate transporter receptor subunit TctC